MIEHQSSYRVWPLPAKGSGHAIGKSYCNFGVSRGDCLFDICIQLGRPGAAWLLSATLHGFAVVCLEGRTVSAFATHASDCLTVKRSR